MVHQYGIELVVQILYFDYQIIKIFRSILPFRTIKFLSFKVSYAFLNVSKQIT